MDKKIEDLAAKIAYECGLGVSEWEAFVEIAKNQLENQNENNR